MYHCPVTFYLVGLPDEIARIIEDAQPQPSFTHHFTRSDEPEEALTAQASAIFADATGHDAAAWARVFAAHRQATTTVTLIVTHDQVPAVKPYFNDIADLWIAPLSAAEASWRFNHWQRACKRYADSWETSQYLEATIRADQQRHAPAHHVQVAPLQHRRVGHGHRRRRHRRHPRARLRG